MADLAQLAAAPQDGRAQRGQDPGGGADAAAKGLRAMREVLGDRGSNRCAGTELGASQEFPPACRSPPAPLDQSEERQALGVSRRRGLIATGSTSGQGGSR